MKNGRYIEGGNICYYHNGLLHREDGPAIEFSSGDTAWYLNDKLHREDGPAWKAVDGSTMWWLNDIQLTEEDFNIWVKKKALNEKLKATLSPKPIIKRGKI